MENRITIFDEVGTPVGHATIKEGSEISIYDLVLAPNITHLRPFGFIIETQKEGPEI